ncbi:MAG: hypothetical protein J6T39_01100 [Clostridia bacterium]|nr:hypothetical protein [Clostridia bacterium]
MLIKKIHNLLVMALKSFMYAFLVMIVLGALFGFQAILVNGGSAEPQIHYRSLIITARCKESELKVGDFVTFTKSGNSYVTHQIVSIDDDGTIICRGWHYDSNIGEYTYQDDLQVITYKNVVGKVVWTNYILGNTIFTLKGNLVVLFGILALVVVSYIVRNILRTMSKFQE